MARSRSPGYPSVSLQGAIEFAEQIYSLNRTNALDRESAAKSMGYSGSSGASDKTIANLTHYGLTEKAGKGEIRITQLAVDIMRPEDDSSQRRALHTAAFNPQLFEILLEKFPDGHFSPDALKNTLSRMGFQEVAIAPASKAYSETCQYLKDMNAYESYDRPESDAVESSPTTTNVMENVMKRSGPLAAKAISDNIAAMSPSSKQFYGGGEAVEVEGERVVYREEGSPGQYLKLVALGELDDYLLEAIEDFVKRQRKRISKSGEPKRSVYEERGMLGAESTDD